MWLSMTISRSALIIKVFIGMMWEWEWELRGEGIDWRREANIPPWMATRKVTASEFR